MRLKTCTKLDPPVDGRDFSRPLTSNGLSRRQTPLTSNRRRVSQRATGNGSGKKKADDADGDDPCRDLTNLSLIISLSRKQFITTKASLSFSLYLSLSHIDALSLARSFSLNTPKNQHKSGRGGLNCSHRSGKKNK